MVNGAGTIKRDRRTRAQVDQLDAQILQVLRSDHPQSVRHVFYRMTDPRLPEPVDKSELGYRTVQNRIVLLRRSGRLPYGWITDATRRCFYTSTFASAGEFVRQMAGQYRADLWRDSHWYCEVWTESRSIAGVIQQTCEDLAVSLYPAGGFASLSIIYEAAHYIRQVAENKLVQIYYIGDYDPAGVLIDQSIERELRGHLGPGFELEFERLGITPEQIEEYDLPIKPRKETDRRSQHVTGTVEAEAMPANVLRSLLTRAVEILLPEDALAVAKVAEEEERKGLLNLASILDNRGRWAEGA
jgi:hypothetical protein